MPPRVTFARFAVCAVAFVAAYVVGAFPLESHMPGYADMTPRTKLLQYTAEAALFLLPAVGLLTWAVGRTEPALLKRFKELNLFVEYVGALGAGAGIGLLCSLPFLAVGIWFAIALNVPFALAAAGAGGMIVRMGVQSRKASVFRVAEGAIWSVGLGLVAWLLLYR